MPFVSTSIKIIDLPVGLSRCVEMQNKPIGIFHTESGLFAVDNLCPHREAPLHEGHVQNGLIVCPWHQWQFRLTDGVCANIPGPCLQTYKVYVQDGEICINIEEHL